MVSDNLIVVLGITCACRSVSADAVAKEIDPLVDGSKGILTDRTILDNEFYCRVCGSKSEVQWREPAAADLDVK